MGLTTVDHASGESLMVEEFASMVTLWKVMWNLMTMRTI